MDAVNVRQLMQEDMKQLNRMVGYVRAEQDAVLAAVVHPDKGGCPEIEVAFLLIPVVQPVREILCAELLKDFFLIVGHKTGEDDIIAGKVCIASILSLKISMARAR